EMLESLGGEKRRVHDRSLLEEITRGEVEAALSQATGKLDNEHRSTRAPIQPVQNKPRATEFGAREGDGGKAGVVTEVTDELEGASAGGQEAPGSRPFDRAPATE